MKTVHEKEKSHLCEPCGKYFADEDILKNHIYQSHSKVTCPQCNKLILNKMYLKKHLVWEHGLLDGAFICEICPKTVFFQKFHYRKHMKVKHSVEVQKTAKEDMNIAV